MTSTNQTQLDVDYVNDCQIRVAAETRTLQKQGTVTVLAHASSAVLPTDVIRLEAVFQGTTALEEVLVDEYLALTSSTQNIAVSERSSYCIIGGSLYLIPAPTTNLVVTLTYTARPAAYESSHDLEVMGGAKELVERLVAAYKLLDDGQPERGVSELYSYEQDARIYRGQANRRGGSQRRMATPLYDPHY